MGTKEKQALMAELKSQGFAIRDLGSWPAKATYYKQNGEAMPNLPADPWSMQKYLHKGFTLVPPVAPSNGQAYICDTCNFEAKSELGLQSHIRKHKRESEQGEN